MKQTYLFVFCLTVSSLGDNPLRNPASSQEKIIWSHNKTGPVALWPCGNLTKETAKEKTWAFAGNHLPVCSPHDQTKRTCQKTSFSLVSRALVRSSLLILAGYTNDPLPKNQVIKKHGRLPEVICCCTRLKLSVLKAGCPCSEMTVWSCGCRRCLWQVLAH